MKDLGFSNTHYALRNQQTKDVEGDAHVICYANCNMAAVFILNFTY